jgi:hypothetical protein
MLGDISDLVQLVSFPLALVGIFLAYREGRNSRDLQAALTFADSFGTGWERSWRRVLMQTEELTRRGEQPTEELAEELLNLLNWLDVIGWLIDSRVLARPQTVLASMSPQLRRALQVASPLIESGEARYGPKYWYGVRTLERTLPPWTHPSPLPPSQ